MAFVMSRANSVLKSSPPTMNLRSLVVRKIAVADHREMRRRQLHDIDGVVVDDLEHDHALHAGITAIDHDAAAGDEWREERRDGQVEGEGGEKGPCEAFAGTVHPGGPPDVVHQAPVLDHDAFGRAGRAGGEDDVGGAVRSGSGRPVRVPAGSKSTGNRRRARKCRQGSGK